jgi:hypothetical protein
MDWVMAQLLRRYFYGWYLHLEVTSWARVHQLRDLLFQLLHQRVKPRNLNGLLALFTLAEAE